jgi:Ran GTPase-activating protein (RanGAP) involved in mRNA processing and transport
VAAARFGLKKNTTLRELILEVPLADEITTISPILTSLRDHPLLRRLFETVLLRDSSKITELDINVCHQGPRIYGLTRVLRALARHPTLTKLMLHCVHLGRKEARLLQMVLCNTPSLQTLVLIRSGLGTALLEELAPALYHNTSIKVLDMSDNIFNDMHSARLLRDIIRRNNTMTALVLSGNNFGRTAGAVKCIADGLGSKLTLPKIGLSACALRDNDVSMLAQTLGSRNTTLQKLELANIFCSSTGLVDNIITSTGVGVLLATMEQNSHRITDLDLRQNPTGNEGASLLASRALGNNALPNLTRLSLSQCGIDDDGFITLISALEQNTSLLHLDLRHPPDPSCERAESLLSERVFLALAESLPEINKVLQRVDFDWGTGIASAMPLLLAGLRQNTSLFRFHATGCAPSSVPPTTEETARCAGGWMYRSRFLPLIRAPNDRLPPRGVWSRALARVATLPDVIFEVLRSKPKLVPSEDAKGKEATKDTGVPKKRKRGDE